MNRVDSLSGPMLSPYARKQSGDTISRGPSATTNDLFSPMMIGDNVESVLSTQPSPEAMPLHLSCCDVQRTTSRDFSKDCISGSESPRALAAHPIDAVSKGYLQLLRRLHMAHCDRKQVLYRIETLPHDQLLEIARGAVELLENFVEACDNAAASAPPSVCDGGIVPVMRENRDSAKNTMLGSAVASPLLSFGSSGEKDSSGTPWKTTGRFLSSEVPFASFASFMTTGSLRSMDRGPIHETRTLNKSKDDDGNKTINKYSVLADLGKGAYGKVKLGVNNDTNETVAIKIVKKSILKKSSDPLALNREIAILKKVRHENIVSLYEVIDDPNSEKLYLVMQYVCNGPIVRIKSDYTCSPLPEETAKHYIRQLLSGVRYLHKRHIVHHDIKPDNILLGADGHVYITDFGVSEMFSQEQSLNESTRRGVGTPIFTAPELLMAAVASFGSDDSCKTLSPKHSKGTLGSNGPLDNAITDESQSGSGRDRSNSGGFDGMASDTWSLGVTAFLMLVGRVPFSGRNYFEVVDAITKHPLEWSGVNTAGQQLDARWQEVLAGMLAKDPAHRWDLKKVKNHPIFTEIRRSKNVNSPVALHITQKELEEATVTCSNFLEEDRPSKAFSMRASSFAQNYVTRLRSRVTSRQSLLPSVPSAAKVAEGRMQFHRVEDHSHHIVASNPQEQTQCSALAASPPQSSGHNPDGSPKNPRGARLGLPAPMLECCANQSIPDIHYQEPTPRFDSVFSVRRPTVAGEKATGRRTSFPPSGGEDDDADADICDVIS